MCGTFYRWPKHKSCDTRFVCVMWRKTPNRLCTFRPRRSCDPKILIFQIFRFSTSVLRPINIWPFSPVKYIRYAAGVNADSTGFPTVFCFSAPCAPSPQLFHSFFFCFLWVKRAIGSPHVEQKFSAYGEIPVEKIPLGVFTVEGGRVVFWGGGASEMENKEYREPFRETTRRRSKLQKVQNGSHGPPLPPPPTSRITVSVFSARLQRP